jgi:hypothetical protein
VQEDETDGKTYGIKNMENINVMRKPKQCEGGGSERTLRSLGVPR